VVAWENLPIAAWIVKYGTWDLASGTAPGGRITPLRGEVTFDFNQGVIQTREGKAGLVEMDIVRRSGRVEHLFWPRLGSDVRCVANELTGEVYLLDGTVYDSMMVRLLLGNPADYAEHFELVIDNGPWCRAYRLRQAGGA